MENKYTYKWFNCRPDDAKYIRQVVFIDEQGMPDSFDTTEDFANHLVIYDGEKAIATCRYFYDEKLGGYLVGRVAVLKERRKEGLGGLLLKESEHHIGTGKVFIHAQIGAKPFYEKQGYTVCSEEKFEEGCVHVWVVKEI